MLRVVVGVGRTALVRLVRHGRDGEFFGVFVEDEFQAVNGAAIHTMEFRRYPFVMDLGLTRRALPRHGQAGRIARRKFRVR